jgi:cytochrome c
MKANPLCIGRYLVSIFICLGLISLAKANGVQEGKEIARKSLCLGCHAENQKVVGPAFVEVAKRYDKTLQSYSYLSSRIKNGGVGAWGAIPMPENKNNISEEETRKVVDWIFSMK